MAKFKIKKEALLDNLNLASLAINRREEDITSNFVFKVEDEKLVILATDNTSIAKVKVGKISLEGDDNESFSFTLKAQKVLGLLGTLKKDNEVEFNFNKADMNVVINETYDFPSLDPDDFPEFNSEIEKAESISEIKIDALSNALKYINGFIGNDPQGRPELTIGLIKDNTFLASNGKTFGVYESKDLKADGFEVSYNVIGNIQKFTKGFETPIVVEPKDKNKDDDSKDDDSKDDDGAVVPSKKIKLLKSSNFFIIASPDELNYYGFRKCDYKFPAQKLQTQIEKGKDAETKCKISRVELSEVINRLSFCIDETSNRMSFVLTGDSDEAELEISVIGSHKRTTTEKMKVSRLSGEEDITFSLNFNHLTKVLPLYDSPEIILSENKAIMLSDELDDHNLYGMIAVLRS